MMRGLREVKNPQSKKFLFAFFILSLLAVDASGYKPFRLIINISGYYSVAYPIHPQHILLTWFKVMLHTSSRFDHGKKLSPLSYNISLDTCLSP